jgi:hypothetical protein
MTVGIDVGAYIKTFLCSEIISVLVDRINNEETINNATEVAVLGNRNNYLVMNLRR